jgi:hypothetical protein
MSTKKKKTTKKTVGCRVTEASSAVFGYVKSRVELYVGIFTIIGMIFGAPYFLDQHYAKASDLNATNSRLEQKILEDRYEALNGHIWSIQEHFKNINKAPDEIRKELSDLKDKKDRVKNRLDQLDKQIGVGQ